MKRNKVTMHAILVSLYGEGYHRRQVTTLHTAMKAGNLIVSAYAR